MKSGLTMKTLFVFGTRPEAIKMAPLIRTLRGHDRFDVSVCVTAQHREMLDQVLSFFDIRPDFDLDLMTERQTLTELTAKALVGVKEVVDEVDPDLVFVQGDTTSTFTGGLAAFYAQKPVAHIEAGLRTGNKYSPYPEELNRLLVGRIADYHFAPTEKALENLRCEGIEEGAWVVGNTSIDALLDGLKIIKAEGEDPFFEYFRFLDFEKRIVLVTNHRRENFGAPFRSLFSALKQTAERYPDVQFVYPVHLNPNVREPVGEILGEVQNFRLIEPLSYPRLIWLMERSHLIITDSGGIQEEGPSLGKPIVVTREVTERQEGVEAGTAVLVGTNFEAITSTVSSLLSNDVHYKAMARTENPYGRGDTSVQIRDILCGLEEIKAA